MADLGAAPEQEPDAVMEAMSSARSAGTATTNKPAGQLQT
jgi:hypothetical protein